MNKMTTFKPFKQYASSKRQTYKNYKISPLEEAINENSTEKAMKLLDDGENAKEITNSGYSILTIALKNNMFDVFKKLIENGADINYIEKNGYPAIAIVVEYGNFKLLKWLIEEKNIILPRSDYGKLPLISIAVLKRRHDILNFLAPLVNINIIDSNNLTPLSYAAKIGNITACKILLRFGADINMCNKHLLTPLTFAIISGQINICKLFIKKGADIEIFDSLNGYTSLKHAIIFGKKTICQLLLNNGANIESIDNKGFTPLGCAIKNNQTGICDLLIKYGANVNKLGLDNKTPLLLSIQKKNVEITKLLLQSKQLNIVYDVDKNCIVTGIALKCFSELFSEFKKYIEIADINRPLHLFYTSLHIACFPGGIRELSKIKELVETGANVNALTKRGMTALMIATYGTYDDQIAIIQYLLDCGTNISIQDNNGFTFYDHFRMNATLLDVI